MKDATNSTAWAMEGAKRYEEAHAAPLSQLAVPALAGLVVSFLITLTRDFGGRSTPWEYRLVMTGRILCVVVFALAYWWRRRRRADPDAPWKSDHSWSPQGGASRRQSPFGVFLVGFGILGSVAAAVAIGVTGSGNSAAMACAAVVWVATLVTGVSVVRRARRGGVDVLWDSFPLRTGSRVRMHVATAAGGPSVTSLCTALRAVRSPSTGWLGHPAPPAVVAVVEPSVEPAGTGPEEFVTLEFDVPADAPGTRLTPGDETHWELVVLGDTARGPFSASVIVPIYAVGDGETRPTDPESGA